MMWKWSFIGILFVLAIPATQVFGADYYVTVNTADSDINPGDGICQCDAFGNCSLEAAIEEANMGGTATTIHFQYQFTGATAIPANSLSTLTADNTVIDASSQWNGTWPSGFPGVELNANGNTAGMVNIAANACDVRGIMFTGSGNYCVNINGMNNRVGANTTGARNVFVSASNSIGIQIAGGSMNTVVGNYFGTVSGETGIAGNRLGIWDFGTNSQISSNVIVSCSDIGLMCLGPTPLINGNIVGSNVSCSASIPNGVGIYIGTTGAILTSNLICGNDAFGVHLFNANGALIDSNLIGSSRYGVGNGMEGMIVEGANNVSIQNNDISCNSGNGISGWGEAATIRGNLISCNSGDGINLAGNAHTIGGTDSAGANMITLNTGSGVRLYTDTVVPSTSGIHVIGNYIGLSGDVSDAGNLLYGILIESGCHDNFIGGAVLGEGNWVVWNKVGGIAVLGVGADRNQICGNGIGVLSNWSVAAPNQGNGILISNGPDGTIIGDASSWGNAIFSSSLSGIRVESCSNTQISVNNIGFSSLWGGGNSLNGISVVDSTDTLIKSNHIALNGSAGNAAGILIEGATSERNSILECSIHDNAGAGIELAGNANSNIQPPVITNFSPASIEGTSCPNCHIEISSDLVDEGDYFEGATTADVNGAFNFSGTLTGPHVTATATDTNGNTSVFSVPVSIFGLGVRLEMPSVFYVPGDTCYLRAHVMSDLTRSNVPLFVLLDVYGTYWFWPGWTNTTDYSLQNLVPGEVPLDIVSSFVWPDIGGQTATGIVFWSALLNESMTEVLGGTAGIGQWAFGYGSH